jgi:hypothetical protein
VRDAADKDVAWSRLMDEMGRHDCGYIGYDGARARYLRHFPDGFDSDKHRVGERNYKIAARDRLLAVAPLESALEADGQAAAAVSAFTATNLLSPYELMRVADMLRGPDGDAVLRAAARFTQDPGATTLAPYAALLKKAGCAKWTAATYLPFLWRPDLHMFLKPVVTCDYAKRVGHSFAHVYAPSLDFSTYRALLDLTARAHEELSDLAPQDNIDVQSFIWVVGAYAPEHGDAPLN